jgi:hypothetical protein
MTSDDVLIYAGTASQCNQVDFDLLLVGQLAGSLVG